MPSRLPQPEDQSPLSLEALNELVETHLDFLGQKQANRFLRRLAARLAARGPARVVGISEPVSARQRAQVHAWLQERLSIWLARHG